MKSKLNICRIVTLALAALCVLVSVPSVMAADVLTNGTFDANLNGWSYTAPQFDGTRTWDNVVFGNASGSMKYLAGPVVKKALRITLTDTTTANASISSTDAVNLSFWWRKYASGDAASTCDLSVVLVKPSGATVTIWSNTTTPTDGEIITSTFNQDISADCDETGIYRLRVDVGIVTSRTAGASIQVNVDDFVLDATGAANAPPVVSDIPNQSVAEGSSFTTITLDDYVADPDNADAEMVWTYSGNTELTVNIVSRVATITIPDTDWSGAETITFRATDPGSLWDEDPATFTVTAQNDPPVVTDIPNQTIAEGATFTTITLDDYVSDVDNSDAEMVWTYSGNTELTVAIVSRVATITIPSTDWNGAETITFRATDPGSLWDEDPATFTVTAQNDPPVVTDIPIQTIAEGATFTTITLDDYVSDVDNSDAEMVWTYSGNTELTVAIVSRVATITIPSTDWNGAETITFRATDPGSLWDEDLALFTVTAQNDQPVVTDIPNQTIAEGATFTTITLDDYVSDVDNSDAEMVWTYSGNTELTVAIVSRVATITIPSSDWNGAETITFRATDPGSLWDEDPALFTVTAQNDQPVVTNIPNQTIAEGSTFATITLDNYVSDPDNTDAEMTWTYSGNTELTVDIVSRVATITIPDINWNGAETITFRATDPGLLWSEDPATLTVTAQNDAPIVAASATTVSPATVNRLGAATTVISANFTDVDQPGVGAFNCTFKIRDGASTELTLVNNQPNGGGGLTISDGGGGSYTASYTYNPDDAQAIDLYDLYFEVSDGSDNAIDPYASNDNELQIIDVPANSPPTLTGGTTAVAPGSGNRYGSNTVALTASFSDADDPGVGAFTCTFKIRDNVSAEYILVNNQPNGSGGLTITDDGGGDYTASYTYNPDDAQTLGDYDLYFEVSDGTDNAIDSYTSNDNEFIIFQQIAPTISVSATTVSPASVNRLGAATTVISANFTDLDQPGVAAFSCTFKIRDGLSAELTLVNNQPNGGGGLTISDGGGGSYTASYTYNPDDAQAIDLYDLYFEVSDGSDNAIDPYASNDNELSINQQQPPAIVAGATVVSVSPVNRYSTNTTVISTDFVDADQPGVNAFTATFKIRDNVSTEYTLVNNQPNGGGGLIITDGGGGNYTASYTYNPDDNQLIGLYDLYFTVSDGSDSDVDDYVDNTDELEIEEILPPAPPTVSTGAAIVSVSPVDRLGLNTTVLSADFSDINKHPVGTFNCTFKIREPNDVTELVLVNNLSDGAGGLTITDNGNGNYTASYTYNPSDVQTIGFYDLYFEVTDGSTPAVDGYNNNLNELRIQEVVINEPPVIATGATQVSPSALDRAGAGTTTISATFNDADDPGVSAFSVTFRIAAPQGQGTVILADALQNGASGMTITAGSGTSYTASISWDPPANAVVGFYDLYCEVSDGVVTDVDAFVNNVAELQVTNGGENARPIGSSDAVFASPSGVERIGANTTTLAATFVDGDGPAVSVFRATFKLRKPDNSTEVVLATNSAHGQNGVTIVDLGGGVYTASISWDPADAEVLGYWDLYFAVTDGIDTLYNSFIDNANELQLYDAVSNNIPSIVSDTTYALPISVNRIGSEHVMLQSAFSDVDMPGKGAFNITFKVRDPGSTEITVVNSAVHGEQGLRVVHKGGGTYEASVLWDPDVADGTGLYDLYFEVTDNIDAAVSDGYTPNSDELTVTSSAVLGDGNLLHRNNTASASCGDATNACHNIMDHQSQDCRVCHTPHGTSNIYLIRETIQTPNSGPKTVDFRTLGIGDPYNDPDPTPGVFAGVMADSTDNVFTGVCEVCHTAPTGHHRNDGSQPGPNHNDAIDCTSCHPHEEGFAVSGGGESSGGSACACHSSTFSPMNTSTTSYHHQLDSDSPDYTISSHTCLSCHVDHDIFRPDLNAGFGTRASNLRRDITTSVVQGSSAVLLNSDYESSGSGGICLSCHVSTQTKRFTPPDASTSTRAIVKADFDASTAHNYIVPNTFSSDGSTFNGVCVKCHTDQTAKSYQASPGFGLHNSVYGRILRTLGAAAPTDPMEEKLCFGCHWTVQNPNSGSNLDYFGVQAMTTASMRIGDAMALTYGHPTTSVSGVHKDGEVAGDFADGNRHAECADCHGVHAAIKGTHDGSTSLASNALKGAWGVRPTWPTAPTPTDNANVFSAPTVFTRVEDATLTEYEICLKCHSNYTTLPSGNRNLAEELNPAYASTHGITSFQTNSFCNSTTMNEPWGTTGRNWCSDCHRSDNAADPEGPHGSNAEHLLVATIVSNSTVGTPLCDVCHKSSVYWDGSATPSDYDDHPATQGQHYKAPGCFSCHMWDHASTAGLGLSTSNWPGGSDATGSSAPPIKIWVHGQNRKWVYNEQDGSAGTQQPVENFINGYIANMDHGANRCWTETCKVHSNKAY